MKRRTGADTMSLKEWISELGVAKVASLIGCTHMTVRHWRAGYCCPTGSRQMAIQKLSKGRVTPARIAQDYWSEANKKRWQDNQTAK